MPCILTRCRAFILPTCNTTLYKHLQRVLRRQCNYTTHTAKQRTGLHSGFSYDCTRSTAHNTRPTKAAIISPAPRWRAYTRPDALSRYLILPSRRTLHRPAQAAYYNNVYKGRSASQTVPAAAGHLLPCADCWQVLTRCQQHRPGAPAEGSARRSLDASRARRLEVWHRVSGQGGRSGALHPAGQSSSRGTAGGAEPLAASAASLFGLSPDS